MLSITEQATVPFIDSELQLLLNQLEMTFDDLEYFKDLSPYLILDGHRTGIKDTYNNPVRGYIEGAVFSLRFAKILKELGCHKSTFLIHTLRNYKTMDRMKAIFSAIENIGKEFIDRAYKSNIKLKYYGNSVHEKYALASLINKAEKITENCSGFELNFITNYSEVWGMHHPELIVEIPEISVIGRFTKGHYSGVGIPGHSNQANFLYIQQASISGNWSDREMLVLALSLLKSHIALNGYVGGKIYTKDEKEEIRDMREEKLWEDKFVLRNDARKRIMSYSPKGPITILF